MLFLVLLGYAFEVAFLGKSECHLSKAGIVKFHRQQSRCYAVLMYGRDILVHGVLYFRRA